MRNGLSIQRAKTLRSAMTNAEIHLWQRIRQRQIAGLRFRRQVPIAEYIVDFACVERKIVIEIDGSQHMDRDSDRYRDQQLSSRGWQVLRFWNNEVLVRTDAVLEAIYQAVKKPPSCPLMCRDARMPQAQGCAGAAGLRRNDGTIGSAIPAYCLR
jgi:very-short-patch-repair endonuclease